MSSRCRTHLQHNPNPLSTYACSRALHLVDGGSYGDSLSPTSHSLEHTQKLPNQPIIHLSLHYLAFCSIGSSVWGIRWRGVGWAGSYSHLNCHENEPKSSQNKPILTSVPPIKPWLPTTPLYPRILVLDYSSAADGWA
jgi:hypothetical protein